MPEDKLAVQLLQRLSEMRSERSLWEREWQDIRDLVRPNTMDFQRMALPGYQRYDMIYDGTAMEACEQLGSGLHSHLTNPAEPWFAVSVMGGQYRRNTRVRQWLEEVTEVIYEEYKNEDTNLHTSLHENYQDLAAFGTTSLNQEWDPAEQHLVFRADALASCYFAENHNGRIDTSKICRGMTKRQLHQKFGQLPKEIMEDDNQNRMWKVVHCVYPRTDRDAYKVDRYNKPFASVWVCEDTKQTLHESGYDSFPNHVSRWVKLANEVYGRGPAHKCLPDIKMLNAMDKTILKAAQKIVDPPLQLPDEGFLMPIKTHPGGLIMYEAGTQDRVEALETKGNIPIGLELTQQKRDHIRESFYADWLRMEKENVEMTAFEVADRREEKLRLMNPMLARQEAELLGPLIRRSYQLLRQAGRFSAPPPELQGMKLVLIFVSAASRAQLSVRALSMSRYVQDILPFAQVNPAILDVIDLDKFAQEMAIARGTPTTILRTPEAIAAIRAKREQEEQMQAVAAGAEPVTAAIKNLAEATNISRQG